MMTLKEQMEKFLRDRIGWVTADTLVGTFGDGASVVIREWMAGDDLVEHDRTADGTLVFRYKKEKNLAWEVKEGTA